MRPQTTAFPVLTDHSAKKVPDAQRATLDLLKEIDAGTRHLKMLQAAISDLLDGYPHPIPPPPGGTRGERTSPLNILHDLCLDSTRLDQMRVATLVLLDHVRDEQTMSNNLHRAMLNILEDAEAEKILLRQSRRALVNILEDIELERDKVAELNRRVVASNNDLEQFAYVASHDLRAPLRVIDNASRWIEEDLREHLSGETRKSMVLLRGRVVRMERMLDDLLEYSRVGRKMDDRFAEVVPGAVLIDDVLQLVSPPPGFVVSVAPLFARIRVHRMPLQQIFLNLIGNAVKHHDRKEGHIEVLAEDSGSEYAFAVKDDGPGIPAQFHEQIFQMFTTLKPRDQVEGTGMGLALVKKYLDVFGGSIRVESREGSGSTFHFTWPKRQRLGKETGG